MALISGVYFMAQYQIFGKAYSWGLVAFFFLTSFKDIVKFISAFTLGHSITLIFATFLKITANYYLIDAVIALSVCYKGFDNLGGFQKHLGMKSSPNLLWAVFIFGLIHGFGLSARLQQLPLPHDTSSLLANIISFNVGVELGQITALIFMLLFLEWARKLSSFHLFSKLSNAGLILAGALLFLMQMHGYQHEKYPDDHGFSKDLHMHHHEDLEEMENAPSRHDSLESESENESEEHGHHHGEGHGEGHHHKH